MTATSARKIENQALTATVNTTNTKRGTAQVTQLTALPLQAQPPIPVPPIQLPPPFRSCSLSTLHLLKALLYVPVELGGLDGDVPPDDRQHGAGDGHPDHRNCCWYASLVGTEVQLGQKEAEGRGLHGGFDGHRPRRHFGEAHVLRKLMGCAPDRMKTQTETH